MKKINTILIIFLVILATIVLYITIKILKMNYKKLLSFLFAMILFSCACYSQISFFKPLPKLQEKQGTGRSIIIPTKTTQMDSTYGAFRPIILTGYSLPDNHVMGGAGFGFQSVTYNYATERYYTNWSINAVGFAGGSIPPKSQGDIISYGIMIGALNNAVMAGACINNKKVQAVVSFGINFNN